MTDKPKVEQDRPIKRQKTGGRTKGVANKTTRDMREAIAKLLSDNVGNMAL